MFALQERFFTFVSRKSIPDNPKIRLAEVVASDVYLT